jgi:hypothetical protein
MEIHKGQRESYRDRQLNPTGTLAAATRDRTHDLQITMGPGDDLGLIGPAANAQLSGDIGLSVANSVRGALTLP